MAKSIVLAWLGRTPATELQELIGTAVTTLDDQTIGSVVPAMMGFVERSTNRSVDLVVQVFQTAIIKILLFYEI